MGATASHCKWELLHCYCKRPFCNQCWGLRKTFYRQQSNLESNRTVEHGQIASDTAPIVLSPRNSVVQAENNARNRSASAPRQRHTCQPNRLILRQDDVAGNDTSGPLHEPEAVMSPRQKRLGMPSLTGHTGAVHELLT